MTTNRPKDGMFQRFTEPVMDQIRALVPDFESEKQANQFYRKMCRYKRFEKLSAESRERGGAVDFLPEDVIFRTRAYRCTAQATLVGHPIELVRPNPMELIHIVAHFLQPGGESPWHGGEFGSIFLELIERMFGADKKRAAKDIMVKNKIKTSVRSTGTREKQSDAWFKRKVKNALGPQGYAKLLNDIKEMEAGFDD